MFKIEVYHNKEDNRQYLYKITWATDDSSRMTSVRYTTDLSYNVGMPRYDSNSWCVYFRSVGLEVQYLSESDKDAVIDVVDHALAQTYSPEEDSSAMILIE